MIFDRWAGRPFTLQSSEGEVADFVLVSEGAVMAVLDESICPICDGIVREMEGSNTRTCDNPSCAYTEILC